MNAIMCCENHLLDFLEKRIHNKCYTATYLQIKTCPKFLFLLLSSNSIQCQGLAEEEMLC